MNSSSTSTQSDPTFTAKSAIPNSTITGQPELLLPTPHTLGASPDINQLAYLAILVCFTLTVINRMAQ